MTKTKFDLGGRPRRGRVIANFQEVFERINRHEIGYFLPILPEAKPLAQNNERGYMLCPFHKEKTPSFVAGARGMTEGLHCFGCGENLDIISFYARIRGVTWLCAFSALARFLKIKIEWKKMEDEV